MSKLVLFGPTALEFYNHTSRLSFERVRPDWEDPSEFVPTSKGVDYLRTLLPFLSDPIHLTVFGRDQRRQKYARCHNASPFLGKTPFLRIGNGILAPPPEIALMQAARGLSVIETALRGSILCAAYFHEGDSPALASHKPFATPQSIERQSRAHSNIPGCRTVRSAAPWMLPNAASPREVALGLTLFLPVRLGGYGLAQPILNHPVAISKRAENVADRNYYIADLCWPRNRLVAEYDSDEFHLASDQHFHDIVKRTALESMGYRVITVSRRQLNDPREMDKVGVLIAKAQGRPWRFRVCDFRQRQADLWKVLGLTPSR